MKTIKEVSSTEKAEFQKNEIARKLTKLSRKGIELLINRSLHGRPLVTWQYYLKRSAEIDAERVVLREELFRLCSN